MQYELQVKVMPIRKATKQAFEEMADRFSVLLLCNVVRSKLNKHTMDGSILRRLRELRKSGDYPYKVIDPINGVYQKLNNQQN